MRYRDISLDELEEIEQELHLKEVNDVELLNYTKIEIYDAMLTHLSILCKKDKDYVDYYTYIKNKLISHLLRYESNIYDSFANERMKAEQVLKNVLSYDQTNPVASYRLGCLFYLQKEFSEAASYFQHALDFQKECSNKLFLLNAKQINRAVLYISNCSLHTACQALVIGTDQVDSEGQMNELFTNFFTQLSSNEGLLKAQAIRKVTLDGVVFKAVEEIAESNELSSKDTLLLYFVEDKAQLYYNGIKEILSSPEAQVLRRLLVEAHKNTVTRICLKNYFLDSHVITGASINAIEPVIENIKSVLAELETRISIQETEGGYQLTGAIEYILMDRVDDQLVE